MTPTELNTQIFKAIDSGDAVRLRSLVSQKETLRGMVHETGLSLMGFALENLLKGKGRQTPTPFLQVLETLIEFDIEVSYYSQFCDKDKRTPILAVVFEVDADNAILPRLLLQKILEKGVKNGDVDLNQSGLFYYNLIVHNNLELATWLLEHGLQIENLKYREQTPLELLPICSKRVFMSEERKRNWIDTLLKYGVSEYHVGEDGELKNSPVLEAVWQDSIHFLKLFLEKGFSTGKASGRYPLLLGASDNLNSYETTKLLLEHGADVRVQDNHGNTALHMAYQNARTCEILLQYGTDFEIQNNQGQTALDKAIEAKNWEAVSVLERFIEDKRVRETLKELENTLDIQQHSSPMKPRI